MTGSGESADSPTAMTTAEHPAPRPETRFVEGVLVIDDLDAFLASLESIREEIGAVVQAFDADRVVDADHLRLATRFAARSIARGEAVARDPAVEILVYAAGRRQIDRALDLGVSPGERRAALVVADFGDVPGADTLSADLETAVASVEGLLAASPEPTLGEYDDEAVRDYYGVTDRELAATLGDLADVVHERVALLDVEK
ncbi:KEOPS complex subunit Cgi121 [Halorubrum aquaticum]|uniref:KEOPS complex subunit Cgi121 n=1 Tax=Halorubrum aquaticum TaxID=387340 RepID=A0A1I3CKS9_9EURY|nr:KEOPS complex subunit Cgi121 [Halorubrum aquaticum]SFH75082.1 KEOPS complex subunit Cgi121 [Halorubrum aquaticum]